MRPALLLAALGLALLAAAAVWFDTLGETSADSETTVQGGDLWFCGPSFQGGVCQTTVSAGDTVQWQWTGQSAHTSTECAGNLDTCPQPHLWDSGSPKSSGTFSFTFNSPGTYVYRCQVHTAQMRGRVIVLAPATPTPTPSPTQTTASPSPGATSTPTPARAPVSGGAPGSGQDASLWWLLLAAGGGLLLAAGVTLAARTARRP